MQVGDLLYVAEKIYLGIHDADTAQHHLKPLWQYPVLLEAYIALLRHPTDEHYLNSFAVVANLLCPKFLEVADGFGALAAATNTSLETTAGSGYIAGWESGF